jgi:hypothetical protein
LKIELGEEAVVELEARRWKVDPIKDWDALHADLKAQLSHISASG